MSWYAQQLSRLRVAVETGHLPRDLGEWALDELDALGPAAERIEARNALLREAAALVDGSLWAKATRLEASIRLVTRGHRPDTEIGRLVASALETAPSHRRPPSFRQLLRILDY